MGNDVTRQVAAASIILAVVFAGITFLAIQGDDDENRVTINLSGMELDLRGLTRDMVQGRSADEENLTSDLMEEITRHILSIEMEGIRSLAIEEVKAIVMPTTIAVDIPTQAPLFKDSRGITVLNSLMYGSSGPSPMVPGTSADVSISLKAIDLDGDTHSESISFSITSYDPKDTLEALLDSIEIDVNTWSSGLSRDVEYMLNTLARTRTTRGIGTGPMDVPRNVLNEGDVELALNIAVAVRIARWTGQYPVDLVENIDHFFSEQTYATTMNPTGFRPWGESEKQNFARYFSSRPPEAWGSRKVSDLLDDILIAGHGDIADIMFNYLYLDGIDENLHIQNPLDEAGPLQISSMSNPRQQYDTVDPYSLATHVSFPSPDGIRIASTGDLSTDEKENIMIPRMDLREDYLVSGRDFILEGINDMDAWYTDIDYTRTMNYYTAYARNTSAVNTSGTSTGNRSSPQETMETRCGSIQPPPPPPDHDWRLQWDLRLDGEMTLDGTISGWGGNIPHSGDVERTIPFGFDIRVHTWFFNAPSQVDEFSFENINDPITDVTFNETASWLIFTPEANATEFFEDMPYQRLREGFEVLVSLDRTMTQLMRDPTLGEAAKRETAQVLAMGGIKQFREWSQRSGIAGNLTRFKDEYITGKITFSDLGAIRVDGMYATFSYSHSLDRLEIEMDLPEGRVALSMIGISVPPVRFEGMIVTGAGLTLSLDSGDGTFIISGSIDGHTFTEGPGRISTPPKAVTSLMIETDWTITSPYREYHALPTPVKVAFDDRAEMELSHAYVISGNDDMDPQEITSILSEVEPYDMEGGYTDLLASGMSIASSLDRLEGKPWFGLSVRYEGGDAEPFSRTIWFLPSGDTTYMSLMMEKGIQNTLINMLWVHAIDLPEHVGGSIRADIILTKETTTENIPLQHEVRATDIIILTHISLGSGNDISLWTFTQNDPSISPYGHMSDDWSRSGAPNPSPLW